MAKVGGVSRAGGFSRRTFGRLSLTAALGLVAGCGTAIETTDLQDNGRYPEYSALEPSEILVSQTIDFSIYRRMAVTLTHNDEHEKYPGFFRDSIAQYGLFDEVLSRTDLEARVIADGLTGQIEDISGPIGLNQASEHYGPFMGLIMKAGIGTSAMTINLRATDPRTADVLFEAERDGIPLISPDQSGFFPIFNAFADWAKSNGAA